MVTALIKDLGALALALAVYGALFGLIGAVVRRPLVVGLVFVFGWEQLATALPGYLGRATVAHYVQALVPHAAPAGAAMPLFQAIADLPSAMTAVSFLFIEMCLFLALAVRVVSTREYVLEQ